MGINNGTISTHLELNEATAQAKIIAQMTTGCSEASVKNATSVGFPERYASFRETKEAGEATLMAAGLRLQQMGRDPQVTLKSLEEETKRADAVFKGVGYTTRQGDFETQAGSRHYISTGEKQDATRFQFSKCRSNRNLPHQPKFFQIRGKVQNTSGHIRLRTKASGRFISGWGPQNAWGGKNG